MERKAMKKTMQADNGQNHTKTTPTRTLNAKGEHSPLMQAYDNWVNLLNDATATDAALAAAKAAFLAAPEDAPTTDNLAYPIVEALERQDCLLAPIDPWYPEIVVADETFQPLPKVVDIADLTKLHLLDWVYPHFTHAEELIFDALERSAYALGYVWDGDNRTFVEYVADEA